MNTRLLKWLGLATEPGVSFVDDPQFGMIPSSKAPQKWVSTTCGYCSVGCGMLVGVSDGAAIAVRGDPKHPVNHGRLCPKGQSEHLTLSAGGRLLAPVVDGVEVSWPTAIAEMVQRFTHLQSEYGPEAVAVISTGQLVTEEFYTLGKLVRLGLGAAHFDGNTTLCMASAVSGYKQSFGSDGPPGAYADLEAADFIMLIGANIADNHPLLTPRVMDNDRATVVVVDPRVTKTAMIADVHLAVRPRSDIALLNAMMKVIVEADLVDHDFVNAHTEGYSELVAHLDAVVLDDASVECGVSVEQICETAIALGRAKNAVIAWTMGVNHSTQGTETVTAINTLCAITGNIGKPGSAPMSITGQCNAMGTREAGFTASMPGYRAYDDPQARAELAELWNVDESRLPLERGRAYPDIIEGIIRGKIKALWIIATNPVVSYPNRELLEYALSKLDVLVVQDGFETPTTKLAHITLPAAIWGEKEGTFTNSERRVSRVRKVLAPPGMARSDFDIFLDVAQEMGVDKELFAGWLGPEDAFNEWRTVSATRLCDYSGITYERIDANGGVQWPCPADRDDLDAQGLGTERLYETGVFPTKSGRMKLHCVKTRQMSDRPNEYFPMLLNTGRTVEHWHTRTKTGRVDILEHLAPEAWLEMNPIDAAHLKLHPGDEVQVTSQRGSVDRIALRVTAIVRPGEVFLPFHYDERCANRLTLNEFDPISREPNYKQCAVRVERSVGRRATT